MCPHMDFKGFFVGKEFHNKIQTKSIANKYKEHNKHYNFD